MNAFSVNLLDSFAKKMAQYLGLSEERVVCLKRNMNGPGTLIHKSSRTEFLTLHVIEYTEIDEGAVVVNAANVDRNEAAVFRITIGNSPVSINLKKSTSSIIIKDLCIYQGDEIWMSTSQPNKYCVYGVASTTPLK